MPKIGLRAGDAFHLAIAANNGAKKILTLDQGFIKVGKQLKLPVSAGNHEKAFRHSRAGGNPASLLLSVSTHFNRHLKDALRAGSWPR